MTGGPASSLVSLLLQSSFPSAFKTTNSPFSNPTAVLYPSVPTPPTTGESKEAVHSLFPVLASKRTNSLPPATQTDSSKRPGTKNPSAFGMLTDQTSETLIAGVNDTNSAGSCLGEEHPTKTAASAAAARVKEKFFMFYSLYKA